MELIVGSLVFLLLLALAGGVTYWIFKKYLKSNGKLKQRANFEHFVKTGAPKEIQFVETERPLYVLDKKRTVRMEERKRRRTILLETMTKDIS